MPRMGFEPTMLVLEWAKTFHGSDRAATVISSVFFQKHNFRIVLSSINGLYVTGFVMV
jgi:hypothetical protein